MPKTTPPKEKILGAVPPAGKACDFPEWVPPMVVKELRQGLRSQGFVLILCLLHLIMLGVFLLNLNFDLPEDPLDVPERIFWCFFSALLLGVTPIRGLLEIHAERETRTLELLSAAGVSGTRVVFGKWCSLMLQSGLITLTMLPYFLLQYFGGAVDLFYSLRIICLGCLLSALYTAAALAFSGLKLLVRLAWMGKVIVANLVLTIFALNDVYGEAWFSSILQSWRWEWVLTVFGSALATAVFLRLAGDTLDMPASNGALWPRVGVGAGWLVWGIASAMGMHSSVRVSLASLMCALTLVVFFWHLQGHRPLLPVHFEPFRKWGPIAGRIGALLFLPTWVGAVFLVPVPLIVSWPILQTLYLGSGFEILMGMLLNLEACFLCFVLLWRLLQTNSGQKNKQPRERDPRVIFGWVAGFSILVSFVPQLLGKPPVLRLIGLYFPLFFTWAYDLSQVNNIPSVLRNSFFDHSRAAFTFYFLAAAITGVLWLTRKKVWQGFWSAPEKTALPSDVPGSQRPWVQSGKE